MTSLNSALHRYSHRSQQLTATLALALTTCLAGTLINTVPAASAATSQPCPNQQAREQQHATNLPDCRAYEQVSPAEKDGSEVNPPGVLVAGAPTQASAEGAGIAYLADGAFPGSLSSGASINEYLSSSSSLGSPWQTFPLNPDNRVGILSSKGNARVPGAFSYFSPDLTCGLEDSALPLTALPAGENGEEYTENLYAWDAASDSYALVTNIKPEAGGTVYAVNGASSECNHVIFESNQYESLAQDTALFEWEPGQPMRVASVLPDGTLPAEGIKPNDAGDAGSDLNEISSDGLHVFFTAKADEGPDEKREEVFLRLGGASTVEVSATKTGVVDRGANFQAASVGGEHVFFTANYGLTSTSSTGATRCSEETGAGCDLYDYDTSTGALTDISADVHAPETGDTTGADVIGVMGISEEGEVIYFSASGQLVPGKGNTEEHDEEQGEANVYAYSNGQLTYVTSIGETEAGSANADESSEEVDAIVAGSELGSEHTVSRVSGNGEYLLFATAKQIRQSDGTIYDNSDQSSGEADFEDYEYSLREGTVTCASCDPDGAQPRLHAETSKSEMFGELGQYDEVVDGYLLRNLAEDGEVFFQTTNPVVPQALNDNLNVYEWEPEDIGGCPTGNALGCVAILDSGTDADATYFDGASTNGENVYLTTYSQLAPEDQDGLRDVYDVRTGGGFLITPPAECKGEECQGSLPAKEGAVTPGSTLPTANGNLTPSEPAVKVTTKPKPKPKLLTRAQKLVKVLKSCRKDKSKKDRLSCEKTARSRYGPKAKKKTKGSKSKHT